MRRLVATILCYCLSVPCSAQSNHPLHTAVERGWFGTVSKMLSDGAPVNALDAQGDTPLHKAFASGSIEMIELLVRYGGELAAVPMQKRGFARWVKLWQSSLRQVFQPFGNTYFAWLPEEVRMLVASFLSPTDRNALRGTCRVLRNLVQKVRAPVHAKGLGLIDKLPVLAVIYCEVERPGIRVAKNRAFMLIDAAPVRVVEFDPHTFEHKSEIALDVNIGQRYLRSLEGRLVICPSYASVEHPMNRWALEVDPDLGIAQQVDWDRDEARISYQPNFECHLTPHDGVSVIDKRSGIAWSPPKLMQHGGVDGADVFDGRLFVRYYKALDVFDAISKERLYTLEIGKRPKAPGMLKGLAFMATLSDIAVIDIHAGQIIKRIALPKNHRSLYPAPVQMGRYMLVPHEQISIDGGLTPSFIAVVDMQEKRIVKHIDVAQHITGDIQVWGTKLLIPIMRAFKVIDLAGWL